MQNWHTLTSLLLLVVAELAGDEAGPEEESGRLLRVHLVSGGEACRSCSGGTEGKSVSRVSEHDL